MAPNSGRNPVWRMHACWLGLAPPALQHYTPCCREEPPSPRFAFFFLQGGHRQDGGRVVDLLIAHRRASQRLRGHQGTRTRASGTLPWQPAVSVSASLPRGTSQEARNSAEQPALFRRPFGDPSVSQVRSGRGVPRAAVLGHRPACCPEITLMTPPPSSGPEPASVSPWEKTDDDGSRCWHPISSTANGFLAATNACACECCACNGLEPRRCIHEPGSWGAPAGR